MFKENISTTGTAERKKERSSDLHYVVALSLVCLIFQFARKLLNSLVLRPLGTLITEQIRDLGLKSCSLQL